MSMMGNLIMVVEDESLLLQAIGKKLQREGFDVLMCTHAGQAIDYLKTLEDLPDVIWLDYYLPDMNGGDFLDVVGKNDKWKNIPVVVVSNSASDLKVKSLLAKGAKKHLLKADYRLDEIVKIIKSYIGKGAKK